MHTIETERLRLRRFRQDDAAALLAYLHEPQARCFLSCRLDDMDAAKREAARRETSDDYVAVSLTDTDTVIGDLFALPDNPDTYAVGWNFNAQFVGAGYAQEAASALFTHLFAERGARRLYAYVEVDNLASRRLCEKLRMREEGRFVEFVSFTNDADGNPLFETTMQYALLRREW